MWTWLISYFTDVLFFQMFVLWEKKMVWITCIIGKAITVATTYQHDISESRVTCIGNNVASSHISNVYYPRLFPTIDISRPIIIWLGLNIPICHYLCQLYGCFSDYFVSFINVRFRWKPNQNNDINGPIPNAIGLTYFTLHVIVSYSSYIFITGLP